MKWIPTIIAGSLALAGCATMPNTPRDDGFARLGEATRVGPLVVRADRVAEDSRCPMNARCIWAGRVVLAATVTEDGRTLSRNLVLGEPALTTTGELMLDSAEPATRTDTRIDPRDYRFHFSFRPR